MNTSGTASASSRIAISPPVLKLVEAGQSYRHISHRLSISNNAVFGFVKRARAT